MISRALFISVAESMVIFRPMDQVGWARASSTVMAAKSFCLSLKKGPPEAVRMTRRTRSSAGLPGQALEDGALLAVDGNDLGAGGRSLRG